MQIDDRSYHNLDNNSMNEGESPDTGIHKFYDILKYVNQIIYDGTIELILLIAIRLLTTRTN